jgi:hypothetical protein
VKLSKCDESIKCMNQNGGSKILTIINFEIEKLNKKKEHIKLNLDKYNKLLVI